MAGIHDAADAVVRIPGFNGAVCAEDEAVGTHMVDDFLGGICQIVEVAFIQRAVTIVEAAHNGAVGPDDLFAFVQIRAAFQECRPS